MKSSLRLLQHNLTSLAIQQTIALQVSEELQLELLRDIKADIREGMRTGGGQMSHDAWTQTVAEEEDEMADPSLGVDIHVKDTESAEAKAAAELAHASFLQTEV